MKSDSSVGKGEAVHHFSQITYMDLVIQEEEEDTTAHAIYKQIQNGILLDSIAGMVMWGDFGSGSRGSDVAKGAVARQLNQLASGEGEGEAFIR